MGITEDQNKLIDLNIEFLKNHIKNYFETCFNDFEKKYINVIKLNVIDENNTNEVISFLKEYYKNLIKEQNILFGGKMIQFNGYVIENNMFVYDLREIIKPCFDNQLINSIYPVLKYPVGDHRFIIWDNSIKNNAERVYIKHLINTLNHLLNEDKKPIYNERYLYFLKPYGFELFEALDLHFDPNEAILTKYTIIYYFLRELNYYKKLEYGFPEYQKFVLEHCKDKLVKKNKPLKFVKLAFEGATPERNKKYIKHLTIMNSILEDFKKPPKFRV